MNTDLDVLVACMVACVLCGAQKVTATQAL